MNVPTDKKEVENHLSKVDRNNLDQMDFEEFVYIMIGGEGTVAATEYPKATLHRNPFVCYCYNCYTNDLTVVKSEKDRQAWIGFLICALIIPLCWICFIVTYCDKRYIKTKHYCKSCEV